MKTPKTLINIGVSKGAVREAKTAIMQILGTKVDEETKRAALTALVEATSVRNTNVSGNTFTQGGK